MSGMGRPNRRHFRGVGQSWIFGTGTGQENGRRLLGGEVSSLSMARRERGNSHSENILEVCVGYDSCWALSTMAASGQPLAAWEIVVGPLVLNCGRCRRPGE